MNRPHAFHGRRRKLRSETSIGKGVVLSLTALVLLTPPAFARNPRLFYTESLQGDTTGTVAPPASQAAPFASVSPNLTGAVSTASALSSCSAANLQVSAGTADEVGPSGISDGAGGALIAWIDFRSGSSEIYAKHILACGALDPAWPAEGVRISSQVIQQMVVVTDGSGGAYVVYSQGSSGTDINAQHLLSTGMVDPSWPIGGVGVCTAAGNQNFPYVTSDGSHGAYITWNDTRFGALQRRVFVQHVLITGVDPAWPVDGIRAAPAVDSDQLLPEICSDGSGGAIVVWGDRRNVFVNGRDIYAQRITASATLLWALGGAPVSTAPGSQVINGFVGPTSIGFGYTNFTDALSNAIVQDGANGCFVTWTDGRTLGSTADDVYAQHLTSTGAVATGWDPNGVLVATGPGNQCFSLILSDGVGGALAIWSDPGPVLAQHISPSGVVDGPAGGAVLSNTTINFAQVGVPDGTGGAIFEWNDNDGTGPEDATVYAQRVRLVPPLTPEPGWPANGVPISTAPYGQEAAGLLSNGAGGAIIYWNDYRNLNWDVNAQEVLASGELPVFSVSGHVRASCPSAGTGLDGVTVDAYQVGSGDLIGAGVTDASGTFTIPDLCWGASYTLTNVTPLDYSSLTNDLPANGCSGAVDFALQCRAATGTVQSMGFWKHEVGVATGGNGHAQLSPATLCSYLDLIAVHFNTNAINPVVVYQPPASGLCPDKLQVARVLLDLQGSAAMIARAKQQLMSLLLNVAAGYLGQTAVISLDGATVSQAITYCDNLIDSPTGDYERAKTIADDINNGIKVPAGMIPLTTAQIAYRRGMEALSFRVTSGSGGATRNFQFMTGARGPVNLRLYDASGRIVAEIYRGEMDAGTHSVGWSGRTSSGAMAARGLYFARLTTPRESPTIKVLQLTLAH